MPFGRLALKRYIWLFGQSAAVMLNKRHVSILDVCCLAVLLFNKATFGFLANVLLGYLLGKGLYKCISTCGSTAACAHKANFTFPD